MDQYGEVLEVMEERAKIKVKRHSACKGCGRCGFASDMGKQDMILEVPNPVGAEVGEIVKISVEPKKVILASLLVYIVPVIALIAAMYISQKIAINLGYEEIYEVIGIIFGLGAMAVVFIVLRLLDKKISESQEFKPVISEIIPKEEYKDLLDLLED